MAPKIEPVGPPLTLGEGPFWDEELQTLFYVDIVNRTIHSYKPDTSEHHSVKVDSGDLPVSLVIKVKGEKNKFLISVKNSLAIVCWDGISDVPLIPEYLIDLESKEDTTRINDGKCDPSHRLWAGTMGKRLESGDYEPEKGSFYCVKKDKEIVKHLSNIGISNGLAWSLDKKKFYYIDSLKFRIDSYDYNDALGTIENEKTVFCFKKNGIEGFPDGMTIDEEGMLWVACFLGAQVLRIDPHSGEIKYKLSIPSLQVTSVVFGGPTLEDLYVTSANIGLKELEEKYPQAGGTFRVSGLGVRGTPSLPVQM